MENFLILNGYLDPEYKRNSESWWHSEKFYEYPDKSERSRRTQ